jgi:hypothetical protein
LNLSDSCTRNVVRGRWVRWAGQKNKKDNYSSGRSIAKTL